MNLNLKSCKWLNWGSDSFCLPRLKSLNFLNQKSSLCSRHCRNAQLAASSSDPSSSVPSSVTLHIPTENQHKSKQTWKHRTSCLVKLLSLLWPGTSLIFRICDKSQFCPRPPGTNQSWGLRLVGGLDVGTLLKVEKVRVQNISDSLSQWSRQGCKCGDILLMIPHQSPIARVRDPEYRVLVTTDWSLTFLKTPRFSQNCVLQVLGLTTPAYKGGVMEGDVLVSVEDTLVTLMKHGQVNTECQMWHTRDKHSSVTLAVSLFLIVSCTNCQPFQLFHHVTVRVLRSAGSLEQQLTAYYLSHLCQFCQISQIISCFTLWP